MSARTRARYGPRIGPKTCAGDQRIWTRRLEGTNFLFLATPTETVIYTVSDDDHHRLTHHWTKDNT